MFATYTNQICVGGIKCSTVSPALLCILKLVNLFYEIVATGRFLLTSVVGRPPVVAFCSSIRNEEEAC